MAKRFNAGATISLEFISDRFDSAEEAEVEMGKWIDALMDHAGEVGLCWGVNKIEAWGEDDED